MKDDPVIKAVRDARHQISQSVNHDPQKLLEYYRQRQERYGDRLVSRHPDESKPHDGSAAEHGVAPEPVVTGESP